jgi:uncharacterized membrane protein YidH (DUF202 family)
MTGGGTSAVQGKAAGKNQPSLRELRDLHVEDRPLFEEARDKFERQHGSIAEEYYATGTPAAALVVRRKGRYGLKVAYDSSVATVGFTEVVRAALAEERQSGPLLRKKARQVLVLSLYTVIAYLFNTLDSVVNRTDMAAVQQDRRVNDAVRSASKDLDTIKANTASALKRSSLAWYLLGLIPGGLVAAALIWTMWKLPFSISKNGTPDVKNQLVVCLAFGGVGAIVSVMSRMTRREQVDVDFLQGRPLTMVAGGFRVIIGAVFGLILYVIVNGGLLPLQISSNDEGLFFAGLAFIAGFSERWAQDSIVQSAPLGQKERPAARGGDTNGTGVKTNGQAPTQKR